MTERVENLERGAQWAGALLLTAGLWLFGDLDKLLMLLALLSLVDWLFGVWEACTLRSEEFSVWRSLTGFCRKLGQLVLVAVAYRTGDVLNDAGALRAASILFFSATELGSILKHAQELGIDVPRALLNAAARLNPPEKPGPG